MLKRLRLSLYNVTGCVQMVCITIRLQRWFYTLVWDLFLSPNTYKKSLKGIKLKFIVNKNPLSKVFNVSKC